MRRMIIRPIAEKMGLIKRQRTKVVVLCGSSRFVDIMAVCGWLIEKEEHAITMGLHLLPLWYARDIPDHIGEVEGVAEEMDELHLRKIDMADEIFVVDWQGYIGESTRREIDYATMKGMTIRYLSKEPMEKVIRELLKMSLANEEK